MASIKISALGELELDRLTDADVFIVNDQDATTQKITFETLKNGLDRDARYFTGPVEFGNTVTFNGPLAGRNVYTKDETLNEITLALQPVKDDVDALEVQQVKITDNLGTTAATYTTDELSGSILSAGPKNVKGALSALGLAHDAQETRITSAEGAIADNTNLIGVENDKNADQDDRLDILEAAVGVDGANITGNTTLIEANKDLIDSLYALQGVAEGVEVFNLTSTAVLQGDYTAIQALQGLNNGMDTNVANIATLTNDLTANGVKTQENRDGVNTLRAALLAALASYTPTTNAADELAAHLESELGANTSALA